ncbi:tissue factor pathway inhibitor 2-like [Carcharodon carcharias]|uniref:tissue factor pathway inhibitor 2-like n=1 Tax=Carcharodon carcharias TaxID=13397 RepID=UPI001B7E32D9|nr:tissue factor pathway inhibitor 2-like [Carcharodon carcharias]
MELQLFTVICSILLLAPQFDIASADNREDCLLLPDPGPCKASSRRYYYNKYTQQCEKFIYGGCRGNENNFESVRECISHCQRIKTFQLFCCLKTLFDADYEEIHYIMHLTTFFLIAEVPKICRLEANVGPCRASFTRYFYNFTTAQCEDFVFGGCYGNANNFKDISTCLKECKPISVSPSFCFKPKDRGYCAAEMLRFYFNKEKGCCETFSYSGCGGNDNNFISLELCQKICQPSDRKTVKIKNVPAPKKIKLNRRKQFLTNPKRKN